MAIYIPAWVKLAEMVLFNYVYLSTIFKELVNPACYAKRFCNNRFWAHNVNGMWDVFSSS